MQPIFWTGEVSILRLDRLGGRRRVFNDQRAPDPKDSDLQGEMLVSPGAVACGAFRTPLS
ncbi:MAG: hypothetical protein H6Q33_3747 [Deltaproteobacteria bacterium]|nr:hypothetical protein [Deltaproteobacteria bacterium]